MSDMVTAAYRKHRQAGKNGVKRPSRIEPARAVDKDGSAVPWERPIPLAESPPVESFPVNVLPEALAEFVTEGAWAIACPADYLGGPLLAIAGGAIGASRALEIKHGWTERPCLYLAVVAPPGSAKSPAQAAIAKPLHVEQSRLMEIYKRQRIAWEENNDKTRGSRPAAPAVFVSDVTIEALAQVLLDNIRGVVCSRDEMISWSGGMDQYRSKGRGADRQFWLSNWSGEPVSVHRRTQEPVYVPHPFCAVVGGLPPDRLADLRGDRNKADGFLDRLLFAYPDPPKVRGETWKEISPDAMEAWADTLIRLWALKMESMPEGGTRPHFLRLDSTGRQAWVKFTCALADEMNGDGFPECLRGPWSKMRGHCARLALILHCLRQVSGEPVSEVDGESIDRAAALVRYFKSHARRAYCAINLDPKITLAKRLFAWIVRERRQAFKAHEAYGDIKNQTEFPTVDALQGPIELLIKHQHIRAKNVEERYSRGRKPAPVYEVNPMTLKPEPAK